MSAADRPPLGSFVMDTRSARVGKVVAADGDRLRLLPIGGGGKWDCAAGAARPATVTERLSAATAYLNARSRGEAV
ncbi:hypothetical protein [Streptomyces sp. NPDC017993]|uniref:hypothetical protein n=1 Tax=Streptomyces sp. NPDC017993 TaxID=3365027 RepID=UPI003790191E